MLEQARPGSRPCRVRDDKGLGGRRHFRGLFGQDGQAGRGHVGEAAVDLELAARTAVDDRDHTFAQGGHERRVVGEDAEIAFGAGRVDLIDEAVEDLALR